MKTRFAGNRLVDCGEGSSASAHTAYIKGTYLCPELLKVGRVPQTDQGEQGRQMHARREPLCTSCPPAWIHLILQPYLLAHPALLLEVRRTEDHDVTRQLSAALCPRSPDSSLEQPPRRLYRTQESRRRPPYRRVWARGSAQEGRESGEEQGRREEGMGRQGVRCWRQGCYQEL